MKFPRLVVVLALLTMGPGIAAADGTAMVANPSLPPTFQEDGRELPPDDGPRGASLETNVLWPFFPGGISELRLLIPLVQPGRRDFRGELVLGAYSDFASRFVREEGAGKVSNLSGKIGWRQYLVYDLHVEVSANLGWRHETERPMDDVTIDAVQARLWILAGYQHELSRTIYANLRAGLGVHLYRSDDYAAEEKSLAPGADLNLGVRF